ncbi:hypothetical protein C0Q70_04882 [Pomacea canaliculata]|uniref:MAM domain-containing protein n=1 Tax=Pomacea canaliculata TaxID=400727 RepID=A0A2T7PJP8_POMCA|nr:hypothetical protein C0Q70_04882 [Pomacea canaliculata]
MYGRNQGARATLTSPWMCEDNFTTICVQFRFMFNDNDGGRLTLKLCHDTRTCEDLWFANSRDKNEWSWYHVNKTVTLTQHEQFQVQFQGEKIKDTLFRETDFYLDNIVYKNTSCTNKPPLHYSSTTSPFLTTFRKSSTVLILRSHQTTETVVDVVDSAVTTGTAAAVVASAMVIAAVVVVVRYYFKICPAGVGGFTRNSTDPSRDIHSIQQLPAAEPEVNIYSDIVYIDTTLPKGNQGSLMASANPYWVSEPVQTSSLVAMKSSMQSEATEETIYQNTDAKEHPGKEFDQDESYLTPCEGEMKMERVYQNVDTSL